MRSSTFVSYLFTTTWPAGILLTKVGVPVLGDRVVVSLVEVVEDDIGVFNDGISLGMLATVCKRDERTYVGVVFQVVANRKQDPLVLVDESRSIGRVGNNLKLILRTDST